MMVNIIVGIYFLIMYFATTVQTLVKGPGTLSLTVKREKRESANSVHATRKRALSKRQFTSVTADLENAVCPNSY